MKKTAEKTVEFIDDVICDICGKSCKDKLDNFENAELNAYWGYTSKRDGDTYEVDMCEDCFDKTLQFLIKLKGSNIEPTSQNNI